MKSTTQPRIGQEKRRRLKQRLKDNDLWIASWNVRTLRKQGGVRSLADIAKTAKLSIVAVQETRWPGKDVLKSTNYTFYYSGKDSYSKMECGTGFLISGKERDAVIGFKPCNERMCTLRVKGKFFNITFINVYAPTEDKSDEVKGEFYEQLEREYDLAPAWDIKIILGDFNAKIGREMVYRPTIGPHSLHELSNDNGKRLIDFAMSRNAVISSTYFNHKDIHKATWRSPDNRTCNQIDHVLIEGRHSSDVLDVRSCRGPNMDTDHYLVKVVLRARVSAQSNRKPAQIRWSVDKFEHEEFREEYVAKMDNRLASNMYEDHVDPNSMWIAMRDNISTVAAEVVGPKVRCRNDWYDEECKQATESKNAARARHLARPTRSTTEDYKEKRRFERKLFRRKKREIYEELFEQIDHDEFRNDSRRLYQKVKGVRTGYLQQPLLCKSVTGEVIAQEERCIARWAEYFQDLLNVVTAPTAPTEEGDLVFESAQPFIEEPSMEEVKAVILELKNNKAPGIDNVPAELLKYGGELLWRCMHELILMIWQTEELPEEWKCGVICPLFKKGDRLECSNYRGITLLNIAYKVLANVLYKRLVPYAEEILGEYQCGFRQQRSTSDQMFSIRQIMEKCKEFSVTTHHLFLDFKSAYDSVARKKLWTAMMELGVPLKLISLVKMTLTDINSRVRLRNQLSEPFETDTGLRQGDPLSTLLFNIALEKAVRDSDVDTRGTIFSRAQQLLAYADDIDIVARRECDVKDMFTSLENATASMGLVVNYEKTKYMVVSSSNRRAGDGLTINGRNIEEVNSFTYLGAVVNAENNIEKEVQSRIVKGNRCYFSLLKLLRSKMLHRNLKCKLYTTLIRPVVTYGAETWCMTQSEESKLRVFEMKVFRTIFGAVKERGIWRRRFNHELLQRFGEPDIVRHVKIQRLRWLGHVSRMADDRPPKKLMVSTPDGRRKQGRPKLRWNDAVNTDLAKLQVRDWKTLAANRSDWRSMLKKAQTHNGL